MQLQELLIKYPKKEEYLIDILLDYQASKKYQYLSQEDIYIISKYLNIPESQICSVVSFYTLLSLEPKGKYIIRICEDVPCFVNNSKSIYDKLVEILNIHDGETTSDRLFTLEIAECLGLCSHSPAMTINNQAYISLTEEKIEEIINDLRGDINDWRKENIL